VPAWLEDWPVLAIYLFFLAGALVRSQALYWLGRGVAGGVLRTRWSDRLDHPRVHRATAVLERWGMPIVPAAFLTVGFQSAVFSATGLLRVGWLRFTLWSIPGALVWAAVWGGIGTTLVAGAVAIAQDSPWLLAAVTAAIALVTALTVVVVRRARRRRGAPDDRLSAEST
jgi:membrane protein DedA with SNARE-associated domain